MAQPGRKSAASLTVLRPAGGVEVFERPRSPAELTDEQARIWDAVVSCRRADWFTPDTHLLLVAYCKHSTEARRLDALIDGTDPAWLKDDEGLARYDRLLRMRELQTRAIMSLSAKMRLAQSSHIRAESKSARPVEARKPWQS